MTINNRNIIIGILDKYQIGFTENAEIEITPDQDLKLIPSEEIIKILGLKQDNGHQIFIEKLHEIENEWLLIFLKYEKHYDVYDTVGEIIIDNFFNLIEEILDGLK